jgi:predicted HD superfamily hydrolase involved in NAD metabolism
VTNDEQREGFDRNKLVEYLKRHVSSARLLHCLGVEEVALKLASKFNVSVEMVRPAALLHDLCREYNPELLLKLAANFGIVIDDIEKAEPLLLHGSVAAAIVRNDLRIDCPEIMEAISFHITGAPGLSDLAKLIFTADFIEPGRTYQLASDLRQEAFFIEPELLLLKVYDYSLTYVVNHGYLVHPRTIGGRNELIMKGIR